MSFAPKAEVPGEIADATAGRSTSLSPTEVIPLVSGRGRVVARPITRDLHWNFRNTQTSSYAFFTGAYALCLGPVDEFDSIIINGKSYQGIYKLRTDYAEVDYIEQVISKETPETFRLYWGLEDQANPTTHIQSLVRDASHPMASKTHPRMAGIAWMTVKDLEAGRSLDGSTPSVPKIEIELYCRSRTAYSFGHVEHGSNPVGTIRDLFTLPRGGLGLGDSVIDPTKWNAKAQKLYDDGVSGITGDDLFTSYVFDKPRPALDVAAEVAGHFGGFLREQDGNLDIDWQPNDGTTTDPTGLREISLHHMTKEPSMDPEGLDKMPTRVIVAGLDYTSDPPLQEDSQEAMVPFARRLLGENRSALQLNRKGFVTSRQLMSAAVMEAALRATPMLKIRLSVLRQYALQADDVTPLRPGDLFTMDWEPIGLDVVVRVMERSKETATSVDFVVQVERGAFPRPYEPAIDPRADLTVEPPADLSRYTMAQLPPDLSDAADTRVAALVERPSNSAKGFKVQFSPTDSWPGQEIESGNIRWAVAAVLQTTMDDSLGDVTVTVEDVGEDWSYLVSQSTQEQLDDQLLLHHAGEWLSIGTITSIGSGQYTLGVKRARLASLAVSHAIDDVVMIIKRGDLVSLTHADFANVEDSGSYDVTTATKYFKIRPYNATVEGNLTAATSLQLRDPTPDQVTGLAVSLQGRFAKLAWSVVAGALIEEYQVYRESWNGSSWTDNGKIGETNGTDYPDLVPSFGDYRWRVKAIATDYSEGGFSAYVTGTASPTTAGEIDDTAPAKPNAPTYDDQGSNLSDDGAARAWIQVNVPALPTGGATLEVLVREDGATTWAVDEVDATPSDVHRINGLAVGADYEIAIRARSRFGFPSAISNVLERTAPTDGTTPGVPTSLAVIGGHTSEYKRGIITAGGVRAYTALLTWSPPAAKDVARYEIALTFTNSDSAANDQSSAGETHFTTDNEYLHAQLSLTANWWRIRSVDRSGNVSAWASFGSLSGHIGLPSGNMVEQNGNGVVVTGISTGNGASVQKVLARFENSEVVDLTGGSPTEIISISLTTRGFSTKPDVGGIQCATNTNIVCSYDYDHASNSSSIAYVNLRTVDGTNLPSGNQRFSISFVEYD